MPRRMVTGTGGCMHYVSRIGAVHAPTAGIPATLSVAGVGAGNPHRSDLPEPTASTICVSEKVGTTGDRGGIPNGAFCGGRIDD
jgi:hypothetical protein